MAKIISVSLPPDLVQALDREAQRLGRSRSWVVAEAARRHLEPALAPHAEVGASFERGRDLTLLEGLALGREARAREAEALWEEAWRFAPACGPFVRVLDTEEAIAGWKGSAESLSVVTPMGGAVREGAVETRVALVCLLLNRERVQYVLIGGAAAVLHGVIRPTRDEDVLLEPSVENARRALRALQGLAFGVAGELDPERVAAAPFTIVGDVPRVDLLTVACGVTYEDAIRSCIPVRLGGVVIPLADIDTLVRAKRTGRARDQGDIEELQRLKELRDSRPH